MSTQSSAKKPWRKRPAGIATLSALGILVVLLAIVVLNVLRNPSFQEMREGSALWKKASPDERLELFFEDNASSWSPTWEVTGADRAALIAWLGEPTATPEANEMQYVRNSPTEAGSPRPSSVTFTLDKKERVVSVSKQKYHRKPVPQS